MGLPHRNVCLLAVAAVMTVGAVTLVACSPREKAAESRASKGGDIERGRALLAQYQCGSCHAIPGVPSARGDAATSLAGFARRSYIAGRLPNRPDILIRWIESPQDLVPATTMPDMGVSAEDARHMAAYLVTLR